MTRKELTFVGIDYWSRAVYKDKNGKYYKDITLKGGPEYIPNTLYTSADGTFEGEPNNPVELEDDEE